MYKVKTSESLKVTEFNSFIAARRYAISCFRMMPSHGNVCIMRKCGAVFRYRRSQFWNRSRRKKNVIIGTLKKNSEYIQFLTFKGEEAVDWLALGNDTDRHGL